MRHRLPPDAAKGKHVVPPIKAGSVTSSWDWAVCVTSPRWCRVSKVLKTAPIRNEVRVPAILPVRIYGIDAAGKAFNTVAHTLNVSKSGALLANVDTPLNVGDVIGVQKGVYKGKFRVVWVGRKATPAQGNVGIICVEGPRNIWGLEDRPSSQATEEAGAQRRALAGGGFARERRRAARYSCDLGVQIREEGAKVSLWSRCTDISVGGCYIDSRSPLPVGTQFELTLFLETEHVAVPVFVRTSFPGMGMGVQFSFKSEDQRIQIARYLRKQFDEPEEENIQGKEIAAVEKLAECVEQLKAWVQATALDAKDRDELEHLAISLRRELQGVRAEMNERVIQRRTEILAQSTPA